MDNAHYTYITLYIMNDSFKSLDCDDDVLLFNQNTYTVGGFRDLAKKNLANSLTTRMNQQAPTRVIDILSDLSIPTNPINSDLRISFDNIKFSPDSEGINCKLLRIGAKGWQEGKLRIQADVGWVNYNPNTRNKYKEIEIQLVVEFCPDEPLEAESPLDDLRKLIQND